MTWFRVGGAGIPATLKNAMNAVFNKKFGTSGQNYPPKQWPDDVNLLGPLPEGTASGSIANFSDGADDVPTKSLIVTIPATLEGVSSVTETKIGKNLLDTANAETKSNNSVNVTCDGKGNYTATGTATGGSANITFTLKTPCEIKSGMYLHLMNSPANANASVTFQKQDNTSIYAPALSPANRIVDLSSYVGQVIYSIRLYVVNNASVDLTFSPMLCYSNTATTFEPYVAPTQYTALLGRTIYGGTADIVNGEGESLCGKIVFDGSETRWAEYATGNGYAIPLTGMKRGTWYTSPLALSSPLPKAPNNDNLGVRIGVSNDGIYVVQANTIQGVTDLASFKAWLSENPLTVIYPLDTSTDFTFTGQEVNTLYGVNNFWNDAGGDTTVVYRRDIDLALQAVSSSRGLMMASRPVTQLIGEESDPDQVNELVENDETEQEGEDNAR